MKEHAIPQDITGYKFHIVGNMTLKQFAEIALGFVVAFFIYKTNLIAPVKWSLILLSAGLGTALAFLPIEERPLDHWFITFFTILYKPTKFYWKKHSKIPEAFTYTSSQATKTQINEVDLSPQRRERITEYLQSVKTLAPADTFEQDSRARSSQLLSIFDDRSLKVDFTKAEKILQRPKLKVEVRSLVEASEEKKEEVVVEAPNPEPFVLPKPLFQDEQPAVDSVPIKTFVEQPHKMISTDQVAANIEIPELENIHVEPKHSDEKRLVSAAEEINQKIDTQAMSYQAPTTVDQATTLTSDVTQNRDLPFPIKPTKPNKLVGMVLTQENDLVNQATITLRDGQNMPVTAVKSNALGQFFVTSQLPNGTYIIDVAKEDLSFRPKQIILEGKVVDPLEIRSNE